MRFGAIFALLLLFCSFLHPDLLELYKQGEIHITSDLEFARLNNWESLFFDYFEETAGKRIGTIKHLVVARNGTIFISNSSNNRIYRFNPAGEYQDSFGPIGDQKPAPADQQVVTSILDDRYLIVRDYLKIYLYDLSGKLIKSLALDCLVMDCVALKDGKIAVLGASQDRNDKIQTRLFMLDVHSGEVINVKTFNRDWEQNILNIRQDGKEFAVAAPFSSSTVFIRRSINGNLILGFSDSEQIEIYSPWGKKLKQVELFISPLKITQKIKKEFIGNVKKSLDNMGISVDLTERIDATPGFFPEYLPFYYNLLVDSDGNLLVFIFPNLQNKHLFQVYSPDGVYQCNTVMNPGSYNIRLTSRLREMDFSGGSLYGLFTRKDISGIVPLRLIRVRLQDQIIITDARAQFNTILDKVYDYCHRLESLPLYYNCREEIEEKIYFAPKGVELISPSNLNIHSDNFYPSLMDRSLTRREIKTNRYIYDYQFVQGKDNIGEARVLQEENGEKKSVVGARLKTQMLSHKYAILAPCSLFQGLHEFRFVKEKEFEGEPVFILNAVPKDPTTTLLSGKVWVHARDMSVIKIEWREASMGNYNDLERAAARVGLKPRFTFVSEYGFMRRGIRFPSRVYVKEAYLNRGMKRVTRSETTILYRNFRFGDEQ